MENIRLAFQGIWGHKMRSFLTMLGIIIGIAYIMTIVSTSREPMSRSRKTSSAPAAMWSRSRSTMTTGSTT